MGLSGSGLDAADEANKLVHLTWVERRTAGMRVMEGEDLVIVDVGLPSDTFNVVCRARLSPSSIDNRVASVVRHFEAVERPFTWWVGPADRPQELGGELLKRGFVETGREPAMAADLSELSTGTPLPGGFRVVRVRSVAQVEELGRILSELGTPPDDCVARFYRTVAPTLVEPDAPIWLYLGYLDDEPVATAELAVGGGVVGLYNIATAKRHRGKGIGSAMTLQPLFDARDAGYETAVLQASDEGYSMYLRLGFRVTGRYAEYHLSGT
jgi:ribosomal protein S18 acetylase RimI-like enzyme